MAVFSQPRASTPVPFLDLAPVHASLRKTMLAEIRALVESGSFINGPQVAEFERAFASYCRTAYCVGVGSGLDALRLGLFAAGVRPGDEVIVPAHTFIATFEAVTQAGAKAIPVDVSECDYNIDVEAAADAIGERVRVLLPVHLYGQLADVERLRDLAARTGTIIVEDACQAHGASRSHLRPGAVGVAAAFSFYPAKNLGAMGDAGALVTNQPDVAAEVTALRDHGQTRKHKHEHIGWTARLDTIQAVVLSQKLPLLEGWNEERRVAASFYFEALDGVGDLRLPPVAPASNPVWHVFPVRTSDPTALAAALAGRGVQTARHYPVPIHLSPAYAHLGFAAGAFPVTEALCSELVSLPLFPGISEEQLESVVDALFAYFDG
jgi:dTDP-4-amino-4,6-dideoxygalactose transaminase